MVQECAPFLLTLFQRRHDLLQCLGFIFCRRLLRVQGLPQFAAALISCASFTPRRRVLSAQAPTHFTNESIRTGQITFGLGVLRIGLHQLFAQLG